MGGGKHEPWREGHTRALRRTAERLAAPVAHAEDELADVGVGELLLIQIAAVVGEADHPGLWVTWWRFGDSLGVPRGTEAAVVAFDERGQLLLVGGVGLVDRAAGRHQRQAFLRSPRRTHALRRAARPPGELARVPPQAPGPAERIDERRRGLRRGQAMQRDDVIPGGRRLRTCKTQP